MNTNKSMNNENQSMRKGLLFPIIVLVIGGVLLDFFNLPIHFYEFFIKKEKEVSYLIRESEKIYTKKIKQK